MTVHEYTFGTTPCLISVEGSAPAAARMYVIVGDGTALRTVGDPEGLIRSERDAALAAAKEYLRKRFGEEGPPRQWLKIILGRTILDEPFSDE